MSADTSQRENSLTRSAGLARASVRAVDAELSSFFETRRAVVDSVGGGFPAATTQLINFVLSGGKRLRPTFAWLGWLGAGGDIDRGEANCVLRACSALELIQACALIHDDIIDASMTRRGSPTVHVTFAEQHRASRWRGISEHFGQSVAILLGDLALCWADDMLRESGLDSASQRRISPVWSAMRTEVLGGQFLDIATEASEDESVEAALQIDRYKTAAYTVERPLHLGAALADADDDLITALRGFGTDIGVAFQLRDDLLGVFGDPDVTGKPSGDDLREGKRTVLLAVALARADKESAESAKILRSGIGSKLTEVEVEELRGIISSLGAVDEVESRIAALTEDAFRHLDGSAVEPCAHEDLRRMAVAATQRRF